MRGSSMNVEFAKGKSSRPRDRDRGDRGGYSRNSVSQKELFIANLEKGILFQNLNQSLN